VGKTVPATPPMASPALRASAAYVLVAWRGRAKALGEWDGAVPYLRRILGFIGITEVKSSASKGSISPICRAGHP
jgi:FMN-dependent NADH-azoreductase